MDLIVNQGWDEVKHSECVSIVMLSILVLTSTIIRFFMAAFNKGSVSFPPTNVECIL